MVIFTKKFGTLDPHLPIVWDKVPKKRFFDTFPKASWSAVQKCNYVPSEESMLGGCWVVGLNLAGHHLSWWSGLIMRHCGQEDSYFSALMHSIIKCPVPIQYISPKVLLFICFLNSISNLHIVKKLNSTYFNIQHLNICLHFLPFFWAHLWIDLTGAPADALATYLNTKS